MINYAEMGGEYLEHYGVKGMKWRRRKTVNSEDSNLRGRRLPQDKAEKKDPRRRGTVHGQFRDRYKERIRAAEYNRKTKEKNRRIRLKLEGSKRAQAGVKMLKDMQRRQTAYNVANKAMTVFGFNKKKKKKG